MENSVFDLNNIKKTYFKLALPVVLGLVISLIYNLADTYFISKTENTLLVAGVSLCSPLFTALMGIGNIFGQGGSSLISRLLGKNDKENIEKTSSFCFYFAILFGIIIAILLVTFDRFFLKLMGAQDETMIYALDYYRVLAAGAPIIVVSFIHSNLVRCEGMAVESMIGTTLGAVINIILDPILISRLGMGARGAAIATVIGYLISNVYFIFLVLAKSKYLSIDIKKASIDMGSLGQILGVGSSAAITNIMQSVSLIIMNQYLVSYGNDKVAAMGIVLKVVLIPQLVLVGFSFGGVPLIGYVYGAKLSDKLKELVSFCFRFLTGTAAVISVIIYVFAPYIMGFFMKDNGIIADGTEMLRYQIISTVFIAVVLLMSVIFQATGKVWQAFVMSISRQGVIYIAVIFAAKAVAGYKGLLITPALSDTISAALAILLYTVSKE